jgi:hypothetical protein
MVSTNIKAVVSIEAATKHHIRLTLDGDQIRLLKTEGHEQANKADVEMVTQLLKANKPELMEFLASKEPIREILRVLQQKLVRDQGQFFRDMDWWDKLERAYEAVWPLDECVMGEDGCLENSIVRCAYCANASVADKMEE